MELPLTPGLARFSAPTICPYCRRSVQLVALPGRIPTRMTAGTDSPHRCLTVSWCACGEPVHPLPDGRRINVADDLPHACREPAPVRPEAAKGGRLAVARGVTASLAASDRLERAGMDVPE